MSLFRWSMAALLAATQPAIGQTVKTKEFGRLADGRVVHEYQLDNGSGFRIRLLDYGGIVRAIETRDRNGRVANVVLSLDNLASYEKRANFGAIIGRYANRLSGHGVTIDGVFHKLATNEKGVISHGGTGGFGAQLWQARIVKTAGRAAVRLRLVSPAGENGFPGTLETEVGFSVSKGDPSLRIDYHATTDAPTVLNLTHHAFFNLAGADSGSVDRQWVRIFAQRFTPLDALRLPTGEMRPVAGTAFDLRDWSRIGERIRSSDPQMVAGHGFDHNFILDRQVGKPPSLAACAYDPDSGRMLLVRTDQPAVQIYTANGFDGSLTSGMGQMLRQGDGFALETQHFADSPRHPEFPSTLLRPGESFTSTTVFTFSVERSSHLRSKSRASRLDLPVCRRPN